MNGAAPSSVKRDRATDEIPAAGLSEEVENRRKIKRKGVHWEVKVARRNQQHAELETQRSQNKDVVIPRIRQHNIFMLFEHFSKQPNLL